MSNNSLVNENNVLDKSILHDKLRKEIIICTKSTKENKHMESIQPQ